MTAPLSRRRLIGASAAGLSALGAAYAAAQAQQTPAPAQPAVTPTDLRGAEALAGVSYTDAERTQMISSLADQLEAIRALRAVEKPNTLAPAQVFDPRLPGVAYAEQRDNLRLDSGSAGALPERDEDIAFASVYDLSNWIQRRALTSRRLTEIYLDRIARFSPRLQCFVTVTAERARAEADQADRELKAGRRRGPLHGIPYGLKDLFDAEGVRTTWGAEPYVDRPPAGADSAVARKLKEAGAVLLGKTATGALAYGDIWFDGVCKNPWNPEEGSSGSSAGSASATAAGLIAFGIGTETLGSIVSPSHRCGTTGLRPTFGRVSRAGGMALCWSLDKVGALCRSVQDTAIVLAPINGKDGADPASLEHGFQYRDAGANFERDVQGMRVGYDPRWFDEADAHDRAALDAAKSLGVSLSEIRLPEIPSNALVLALLVEAAAAFEDLTVSNKDDLLDWQDADAWPNTFRQTRFVSAIDYVQVDRVRRQAMQQMHEVFSGVDALIGPNFAGGMLVITNFTGHPQLAYRSGFIDSPARSLQNQPIAGATPRRVPRVSSLWAPLFEERNLVRLGRALEARLNVAHERPNLV